MKMQSNQNGNVLVIVLAVTAVMAIGMVTIMTKNQNSRKAQQQTNLPGIAEQIKSTLVGAVMSPQSWQVIQMRNSKAFTTSPTQIYPQAGGTTLPPSLKSLDIYLENSDAPFYAATNPNAGFTLQGVPCTREQAFSETKGSDQCPFRYNVYLLSHVFVNNAWVDTLRFELLFRPRNLSLVLKEKDERYTFNLVRNVDENNVEASCKSLNGVYSKETGQCSVSLAQEIACPSGQSYRGPTGSHCATSAITAKTCASGQAIYGFDSQGNAICANVSN